MAGHHHPICGENGGVDLGPIASRSLVLAENQLPKSACGMSANDPEWMFRASKLRPMLSQCRYACDEIPVMTTAAMPASRALASGDDIISTIGFDPGACS